MDGEVLFVCVVSLRLQLRVEVLHILRTGLVRHEECVRCIDDDQVLNANCTDDSLVALDVAVGHIVQEGLAVDPVSIPIGFVPHQWLLPKGILRSLGPSHKYGIDVEGQAGGNGAAKKIFSKSVNSNEPRLNI
jgi:hypothetical protein